MVAVGFCAHMTTRSATFSHEVKIWSDQKDSHQPLKARSQFTMEFSIKSKIFQHSYLGEARELEAHIPPIVSTLWYYRSPKYELHTPSVSGQTKNRVHVSEIRSNSPLWTPKEITSWKYPQSPRNFGLVRKNDVSKGSVGEKYLNHNGSAIH